MNQLIKLIKSRLFHFFALPIIIAAIYVYYVGLADVSTRVLIAAQLLMLTGPAYLVSKALLGKASSQELYDRILDIDVKMQDESTETIYDDKVGISIGYLAVVFARVFIYASMVVGYAWLLH